MAHGRRTRVELYSSEYTAHAASGFAMFLFLFFDFAFALALALLFRFPCRPSVCIWVCVRRRGDVEKEYREVNPV